MLAPPSIHPSGRPYAWSVDSANAFAAAPQWLLARINGSVNGKPVAASPTVWSALVLDGVDEGQRNDASHAPVRLPVAPKCQRASDTWLAANLECHAPAATALGSGDRADTSIPLLPQRYEGGLAMVSDAVIQSRKCRSAVCSSRNPKTRSR